MLSFKEYYDKCKKIYSDKFNEFDIFDKVNLHVFNPSDTKNVISVPDNYLKLIDIISKKISDKIEKNKGTVSEQLYIGVHDFSDIEELNLLGNHFAKQMEKHIYESYTIVDHLHIYRNICTQKEKLSSWLWHNDNSVNEQLKIMVYLTDVDGESGPLNVLVKNNLPLKLKSSKISPDNLGQPKFLGSRIPDEFISMSKSSGWEQYPIKREKGTYILFDQNMIHKATIPKHGKYRDVLIFNFRPFHKNIKNKMEYVKSINYSGDVKTFSTEII